ncbi:MAG: DinB family protein [Fimbriimonadaceae bacterium]
MSFLDCQSQAWDSAHWEFSLVFEDLDDDDLWRRADPRLLSVGEIVCHMSYAQIMFATKLDPGCGVESPLAPEGASYYLHAVDSPQVLAMSVEDIAKEFDRVQKAAKVVFLRSEAERETPLTFEGPGRTFGEFADYMVFHVAYHTGQAFSARHLMGHRTNDN